MAKLKSTKKSLKSKEKLVKFKKGKVKTEIQKKIKVKRPRKDKLGTMSVSDFMSNDFENSESEELSESELLRSSDGENNGNDDVNDSEMDQQSDVEKELDDNEAKKHKKDLEKLKKTDPEFYKFLQENDKKLLQFTISDEEPDEEEEMAKLEDVHKATEDLEVASDESDYEADGDKPKDDRVITLKMLRIWQSDIKSDKSNKTIITLTQAFHAALQRVANQEDDEPVYFRVEGSSVFNGVIQLCVLELGPAIRQFLGLNKGSKQLPHKCKKFIKIKKVLKSYFNDLLKLLLGVSSNNIHTVLLKHLHYMSNLLVSFSNTTKSLMKRLINFWGTADDSVRVLAFFCILRITSSQQSFILDTVLKSMYMTYVKNSKFVNFKGLPVINFMRRSLVEMYALDTNFSYQHVFLYIRQLAIHLRNAITVNKTENIQAVYNWQFVNSLMLWGNLLTVTYHKTTMQQLVYPFVQVCIGTLKLIPTVQYYPLRFHVVQILMDLSKDTEVFIPILPFILEVLTSYDFNKKHQKVSMKPLHFTCLLRVSNSQLQENGFKDMLIDMIYGLLLEYLSTQSHTVAFPDLSLICIIQLKQFMKKSKNPNYTRKMKQLLEKIEQNNQFMEKERAKMTFKITDFKEIEGFETQIKNRGTPLMTYFESWNKLRTIKKNKLLTSNDELADYKLPTLKKTKRDEGKKKSEGPVELFPSDSEDDDVDNKTSKKRGKRGGKKFNRKIVDQSGPVHDGGEKDLIEDIRLEDW